MFLAIPSEGGSLRRLDDVEVGHDAVDFHDPVALLGEVSLVDPIQVAEPENEMNGGRNPVPRVVPFELERRLQSYDLPDDFDGIAVDAVLLGLPEVRVEGGLAEGERPDFHPDLVDPNRTNGRTKRHQTFPIYMAGVVNWDKISSTSTFPVVFAPPPNPLMAGRAPML